MARVIVAEQTDKFDLSEAKAFGDLTFLASEKSLRTFNVDETVKSLSDGLDSIEFDPEKDCICMSGQSIVLSYLLTIATVKYKKIKILLYDGKHNIYQCRWFSLNGVTANV